MNPIVTTKKEDDTIIAGLEMLFYCVDTRHDLRLSAMALAKRYGVELKPYWDEEDM